jgi:hypothetical protein
MYARVCIVGRTSVFDIQRAAMHRAVLYAVNQVTKHSLTFPSRICQPDPGHPNQLHPRCRRPRLRLHRHRPRRRQRRRRTRRQHPHRVPVQAIAHPPLQAQPRRPVRCQRRPRRACPQVQPRPHRPYQPRVDGQPQAHRRAVGGHQPRGLRKAAGCVFHCERPLWIEGREQQSPW